jgi:hypothetical protein
VSDIGRHLLWLYGVVVGLAIGGALNRVVPQFFDGRSHASPDDSWHLPLEALRLLTFLFLAIRYYLGAASYLEHEHGERQKYRKRKDAPPETKEEAIHRRAERVRRHRHLVIDFLFGFFHFAFFFVWSLTVDMHSLLVWAVTPYALMLGLVLLYDGFWYLCRRKDRDGTERMRKWAVINAVTFIACAVGYWIRSWSTETVQAIGGFAEMWMFVPIVVASVIDIAEVIKGEELYLWGLYKSLRRVHRGLGGVMLRVKKAAGKRR